MEEFTETSGLDQRTLAAGKAPSKYWSIIIRKIITNDVYLSTQWYNRKRSEKNPDASGGKGDAKYRISKNPKEDWIAVPVPDSGIPKEWIESARKIVGHEGRRHVPRTVKAD